MNKLWKFIGNFANLITVVPLIVGIVVSALVYLVNLDDKLQFITLFFLLIVILTICGLVAYRLNEMVFPKKPRVIKSFDQPDTYIFYQGVWRKIPDPKTRDYLAHILGFRPGEEDIEAVPPDFVRQMKIGAPLESILTYLR